MKSDLLVKTAAWRTPRLAVQRSRRLLDIVPSTLSRIETGKAPTKARYLDAMLDLYGIDDPHQRAALANMAREGRRKE